MKIKFINAQVLLNENQKFVLKNKQVLINNEKIEKIANVIEDFADKIVDVKNNILMPGFVNAHAHNVMSLLRGIKQDVPLQTWLFDHIFPNEDLLTEEDVYYGEMLGIAESLKAGITCFEENYFCFKPLLKAIKQSGVRARVGIGKERNSLSVTTNLEQTLKLFDKNCSLIKPVVYPHSIYTITPEELDEFVNFSAKHNLKMATHLSETLQEVGDCIATHKKTPPRYLEDAGFLDRGATLYHCVHLDKDDVEILKSYDASIVTCPSSNLVLGSGICPINTFLNQEVLIGIGTDGPASNNRIDMFKEMFLVASLQKGILQEAEVVSVHQVLQMATENGAKILGFDKVGKIEEGYFADLILINIKNIHNIPHNDLVANLVYSTMASDVYFTMVNGKILYEDGKLNLPVDEEVLKQKALEIAKKFK